MNGSFPTDQLIGAIGWLLGILVSFIVSINIITGNLSIPYVSPTVTSILGWLMVVLTVIGIIVRIFHRN